MKPYSQQLISIFKALACRGGDLKQYKEFAKIHQSLCSTDASPLSFQLLLTLMGDYVEDYGFDTAALDFQPGTMTDKLFTTVRKIFTSRRHRPDLQPEVGQVCFRSLMHEYFLNDAWLSQHRLEKADVVASDFSRLLMVDRAVPLNILPLISSSFLSVEVCIQREASKLKAYAQALRNLHFEVIAMPLHQAVAYTSHAAVKIKAPIPSALISGMFANPELDRHTGVCSLEYGKHPGPEKLPALTRLQIKQAATTAIGLVEAATRIDNYLHNQYLRVISLDEMETQQMIDFWAQAKAELEPTTYTWLSQQFDESYALAPHAYWLYSYISLYLDVTKALVKWIDRSIE